jgi:hypothetical protein
MVGAGGEIDIIVTRAAGHTGRIDHESGGLRSAGGLLMANLAALGAGWIDYRRIIAGPETGSDLKCSTRDNTRQRRTHVDSMNEAFEIDGAASVRVDVLWCMAHHAEVDSGRDPPCADNCS